MKRDPNSPVQTIIRIVAEATGITPEEIVSRRKMKYITDARNVAMVLAYEMLPDLSMRKLEWEFQRDHTTIKAACGRLSRKKATTDRDLVEKLRPLVRTMLEAKKTVEPPKTKAGGPWIGSRDIVAMIMREIAFSGIPLSKIEQGADLTFGFLSRYRCRYADAKSAELPPMPIWAVCNLCRFLGYTLNAVPLTTPK